MEEEDYVGGVRCWLHRSYLDYNTDSTILYSYEDDMIDSCIISDGVKMS